MKKILIWLTLAAIPATFGGCAGCCPTGALCPCCPCNWFNRQPVCPPAYAAPVAMAPVCAPAYSPAVAPMPQYVTPMAAPMAAAAPCQAPCATWNPCQQAVMAQPQASPCCAPQVAQPMMAQPAYYAEPSCGYAEASCGAPFTGVVSYGPEMPVEYGPCGGGGCCESGGCGGGGCQSGGCCDGGAAVTPPAPESYVEPRPAAE